MYYYVRGWNAEDPNATCRHERKEPAPNQEDSFGFEVVE